MSIDIFGFRALWSPYFLISLIVITILYLMIVGPWRHRFAHSERTTVKTKILFVIGMVLLYLCKGSPIDLLGHMTMTAHMTQMAVLYLIVPTFFILGVPNWLWRKFINLKGVKPLFTFLTKPLIALVLFNGSFSLYHIPLIFDFVKINVFIHAATTIFIFIAAFFMWWPLINNLEEWNKLSGLKKVGYIFADGMLLTPACALIIFSDTAMYSTYTDLGAWTTALALCVPASMLSSINLTGPEMFNFMPPLEDQRTGGVIMKIIQEFVYAILLSKVFFEWVRKEREEEKLLDERLQKEQLLNPQTN